MLRPPKRPHQRLLLKPSPNRLLLLLRKQRRLPPLKLLLRQRRLLRKSPSQKVATPDLRLRLPNQQHLLRRNFRPIVRVHAPSCLAHRVRDLSRAPRRHLAAHVQLRLRRRVVD